MNMATQDPDQNADNAQHLDAEEGEAVAVEDALAGGEQAGGESAPGTVDAVDRRPHRQGHRSWPRCPKKSTEKTTRTPATMPMMAAPKGSTMSQPAVMADEAGQRAVEGQGDIGLAVAHPGGDEGRAGSEGGGQVGVEADEAGGGHGVVTGHGDGGAAVETEPAEPEDEDTEGHGGQVVAGDGAGPAVLAVLADTGTPASRRPGRR